MESAKILPLDPYFRHMKRDALPRITFNGLAGPDRSYHCGEERRLGDAGAWAECVCSFAGSPGMVAEFFKLISDAAERNVARLLEEGKDAPPIGIGWWKGQHEWDLLLYMEVGDSKGTVPVHEVLNENKDLWDDFLLLVNPGTIMWGCPDTFWKLARFGHQNPERQDTAFDLCMRLATNQTMRGETLEEEEDEEDSPQAPVPGDAFQMMDDPYAYLDSLAAWDNARKLSESTQEASKSEAEPAARL